MNLWKQKNYTGDDITMFNTFALSLRKHQNSVGGMVCCF